MDIWDPSFMELLNIPIPEDVVSLTLENELQQVEQVSGTHTPIEYCPPLQLPPESTVKPRAPFANVSNVAPNAYSKEQTSTEQSTTLARFPKPLSASQIEQKCKPSIPKNTQVNTSWAVSVFDQWVAHRNRQACSASDKCPISLLTTVHPTGAVDYWLAAFILEARRKDGEFYPPNTVRNILAAIFRHMKAHLGARNVPNMIDKKEHEINYPRLHNTMDGHFKQLRSMGVGVQHTRAQVITLEDENKLWSMGVLGTHSSKSLLNTVFFYNGKNFMLHGVEEHFSLRFGQLVQQSAPVRYTYYKHGSKNHQGGITDNTDGKVVTIVHQQEGRSHVSFPDFYLSKVPPSCIADDKPFYLQPLPFTLTGSRPWFFEDRVGKVKKGMVKQMFQEAKIDGKFTNHSLHATRATALFDANVPEAIIQKRSGHLSTKALRMYERVTPQQNFAVSKILQSDKKVTFKAATKSVNDGDIDYDSSFSKEDLEIFEEVDC